MYLNYGDKNFFEWGTLVEEHSDTEFSILICRPYGDTDEYFQFGECTVDIDDTWIDRDAVMNYIGMSDNDFDPIQFAIGCIDYYGADNFGVFALGGRDWRYCTHDDICEVIKSGEYDIELDNVEVE